MTEPIAIVGLACRYPDADSPGELWQLVLDQRQAFRELPPERLDLTDYFDRDRSAPDKIYSRMAALLEGWRFDRSAFRIPGPTYRATDPAHWLALETASRALTDAGFPDGAGLNRDRVGVVIGNSLTGEVTRAGTMRLRWPYVRRTLSAAAADSGLPADQIRSLLAHAEARYLDPFPAVSDETLAGSLANTIAGRMCNHFDLHGGGYTVDGACSSSLLAVITACRALADGSADAVLAGGVDLSIDPFELVGFAKAGALTPGRMRVYDERSAGFIPGEGCGMVLLMRATDARASGVPAYAEITGWGVSSDGNGGITRPEREGQLRALRRAYALAGIDPAAVGLFEGHGTGTAVGDETELSALTELRRTALTSADGPAAVIPAPAGDEALTKPGVRPEAVVPAALGSIKANIGHTKAASGLAGLIKVAMSVATGVLPPTTGCERPHPVLRGADAALRVLSEPEPWPEGPRLAGVSSSGFGGINAHLTVGEAAAARVVVPPRRVQVRPSPRADVFALAGDDPGELRAVLDRLAVLGPRLSEAELHDVACRFAAANPDGKHRVALVADSPRQLAERAGLAAGRLAGVAPGSLVAADGVFLGSAVAGRVTLLLPGQGAPVRTDLGDLGRELDRELSGATGTALAQPVIHRGTVAALRWLDGLGVVADAAIGHSLGEIAGLVWAGCVSEPDGDRLVRRRGELMESLGRRGTGMASLAADVDTVRELAEGTGLVIAAVNGPRSAVLAGPVEDVHDVVRRAGARGISAVVLPVSHGFHSPAMAACVPEFAEYLGDVPFRPPARRLFSSVSGRELTADDDIVGMLAEQLVAPVRFWDAVGAVLPDTDLFCEAGPGHTLSALVSAGCDTPVVGIDAGAGDDRALAETTAALFAVGALRDLGPVFTGRASRPIDIWRDRHFLANPCSTVRAGFPTDSLVRQEEPAIPAGTDVPDVVLGLLAEATELDPALLDPDARLLGDLHLTSLRVTQLVVTAAEATGRARPAAPLLLADATVTELIDTVAALPPADENADAETVAGLASWIECFAEDQQRTILRPPAVHPETWRPHLMPGQPLTAEARELFGHGAPDSPIDLVYVPDPAAPGVAATLLEATRSAIRSGALIAITHGSGLDGYLRAVRQEHPELGVTLLRTAATAEGLRLAAAHATVEPGTWRELVLEAETVAARPRPVLVSPNADGPLPVGESDVLLVSGGGKGIGYVCAAALAESSGVALALLGRSSPEQDETLRANLERLRDKGIRAEYESVDVTDPGAVTCGVGRLTRRLGPITGVLHASGINEPGRLAGLDVAAVEEHLAPKVTGLRNLLAAVDRSKLRLLNTFGSIIGRYGLAGECHYALANGAMRAEAERLAGEFPDCRVLNLDWSVWSGAGMGEQLGVVDTLLRLDVTPIPAADGVRMFLDLLRTPDLPGTVAVHGRLSGLLPPDGTRLPGRFLERPLVHYPGVELVAEADLDLTQDAYLDDHRIDGLAVLPGVVGMEAMAEAAAAVAGRPLRRMVDVSLDRPVVLGADGRRTIRVCALRQGEAIEVAVRSAETDYCVDHFRATFPLAQPGEPIARPDAAESEIPLGPDELYGPLYFHTGRFRLVERFGTLGARTCHVHLRAPDDEELHPLVSDAPLLGDFTSNDATVHALQACVPHRRLLPVGCERFTRVAGTTPPREIFATERESGNGEYVWDVLALDKFGKRTLRWVGLRLRDVGPLPADRPWSPPLLGVYLERCAVSLGLHPDLTVHIGPGERGGQPGRGSRSYANGMRLEVSAGCRTACDWEPVVARPDAEWRQLIGPRLGPLLDQLRARLAEQAGTVAARIWTALECLSKLGYAPSAPVVFDGVYDGGWVVLRAGAARIASTVVPVAGAADPVAIAVLTAETGAS